MPLNGSGGVTQPASSIYPAVANTLIESSKFNISVADIYSILGSAIYKDGQQTCTQRIPFAQGIQTDSVTEKTADTGVTLDSVLLKDGRIDTTQGSDIVCAATINLETATGNVVDVTGSTGPVTAITLSQGHWRLVRFTGTPTFTHSATLVLPTAADYTATAGDYILFVGYAASTVRAYIFPTSGPIPFVDSQPVVVGSTDKTKKVRFEVDGLTTATTRVLTVQDADQTLVGRDTTDTLTMKTLTAPAINGAITGDAVAAQAEMETATAVDSIVTPGRQHFHPGSAKAWVKFNSAGTVAASYNITSITDNGTGNWIVNVATDFSTANYCGVGFVGTGALSAPEIINLGTAAAAGTFQVEVATAGGAADDPSTPDEIYVAFFGDQ